MPSLSGGTPATQGRNSGIIESHVQAVAGLLRQLDNQLSRMDGALDRFSGNDRPEQVEPNKAPQGCASGLLVENETALQRLLDRSEILANAIEEII